MKVQSSSETVLVGSDSWENSMAATHLTEGSHTFSASKLGIPATDQNRKVSISGIYSDIDISWWCPSTWDSARILGSIRFYQLFDVLHWGTRKKALCENIKSRLINTCIGCKWGHGIHDMVTSVICGNLPRKHHFSSVT
ncbi:hypothetical protein Tsubulata_022262 [Turnera subulata]|uniref:Uncharacterized protein n=1 Tax=Turnera subulata TaxID=218843 RepID=A0A9Q0FB72_9ROSI|nr:hypothetical protein Tsubulata_022262 [Turnera subulata]